MKTTRIVSLILIGIILIALTHHKTTISTLLEILYTMHGIHLFCIFSVLYLFSNLLLIPTGLPMNLLAGILWGTFSGGIIINLLAALTAGISFMLSRRYGSALIKNQLLRYPSLADLKKTITTNDFQFIFMLRINPIVPFNISSYLFGLIPGLSFKRYMLATVTANILPCFAFATLGATFQTINLTNTNSTIRSWTINIGFALLLLSTTWLLKKYYAITQISTIQKKEAI